MSQSKEKYRYSLEILRIICSLAVVSIHTIYQSHLLFQTSEERGYLPYYNFLAFAVPIFVMITGAIWLNPGKSYNLKKCLCRVLLPLFSFGIVFSLMERVFTTKTFSLSFLFLAVKDVLMGESWDIFWYIYMLIGLYFTMPIFRAASEKMSKKQIECLIVILFVFTSVIPEIEEIFSLDIPFFLPINSVYVLYMFLGYYFSEYKLKSSHSLAILLFGVILNYLYTILVGKTAYLMVQTVIYSLGIYTLFISHEEVFERLNSETNKFILLLSKSTFGVYIIHMLFTNVIYKVLKYNPYKHNTILSWIAIALSAWTLSVVCTLVIQRIPVIKKIWKV